MVDEERHYQEWGKGVDFNTGIVAAKRALNILHGQLAEEGFNQVYVDQMDPNVVAVTRHSPSTHQTVILVAHTAFSYPNPNAGATNVRPLRFEGVLDEIILEASLTMNSDKPYDRPAPFTKDEHVLKGFNQFKLSLQEHIPLAKSQVFETNSYVDGNNTQLNFVNLKPGTVVAIRVSMHPTDRQSFDRLHELTNSLRLETEGKQIAELKSIVSKLDLNALSRALFSCDQEERDMGLGGSAYDIPNFGPIVYCGLQGFVSLLTEISPHDDLGHPLCNNLRDGNWMMGEYSHILVYAVL